MKYSTSKIRPANMNNSAGKALVKSPRLRSKDLSISDYFTHYFYLYKIFITQCSYMLPDHRLLRIQQLKLKGMAHKCAVQQHLVLNRLHTANFYLFDASQNRNGSDNLNLLIVINIVIALHINPFFLPTPPTTKS